MFDRLAFTWRPLDLLFDLPPGKVPVSNLEGG